MNSCSNDLYRVLIVDDDPSLRRLLAEVLKSPGRSVELRDSAAGGLEYARDNPVDLAFVDVELPGMSGLEFAQRLKQSYPRAYVVICTGYAGQEVREQALAARADHVLEKPMNLGEILHLAEEYAAN
ncbi:response regulator [bacterium]|nr:response regulator [bacterium]